MKKWVFSLFLTPLAVVLGLSGAWADQFEGFKGFANRKALKAFTRDVGGLVGSGSFHTGRSLGFPGVDTGFHMVSQSKPSEENTILRDSKGKTVENIVLPMLHGEIGLPYNFDFIVRGVSYQEFAVVGGGVRHGLFRAPEVPWAPAISVSAFTHVLSHDYFSLTHISGNVALDFAVPFLNPYLGAGVDSARVKVKVADDASLVGLTAKESGVRGVIGANLKPLPLLYINVAYALLHGQNGFEAGAGLKF